MKLSIITINYNNCDGLHKTINSVMSQTCHDFEWVVIDGGSTDGSKELIEKYRSHFAYWCSKPDRGIYHAMNKGVRKASGQYLLFLNSGDVLHSSDVLYNAMPLLKNYDFIIGNIYKQKSKIQICPNASSPEDVVNTLTRSAYSHPSTFIKKTVFQVYGYFREDLKIVSDWWLYYSAILLGNATISTIPLTVSEFDEDGISSTQIALLEEERKRCLSEKTYHFVLYDFYNSNRDLIEALKSNKAVFFIFRVFFYIYRKCK